MVMGIAYLVGSALLGIGVINRTAAIRAVLNPVEQILGGLVTGWMLTTLCVYFIARLVGNLSFRPLLSFTVAIWVIALLLLWQPLRNRRDTSRPTNIRRAEYGGLALVLVLFAPFYLKLFSTHMLKPGAEGIYSGGNTWYDIGFHLALTTSFLHGQNFPPLYTPFPPEPLLYPFLSDFQISILAALGMHLRTALLVTSIPLALTITGLFYSFAARLVVPTDETSPQRSPSARPYVTAALATILFLLNGGLGFIYFYGDWRRSGKTLGAFWSQLDINYANIGDRNIQWTNFITDTMLPQRASLFGFAAAIIVFTLFAAAWQRWHRVDGRDDDRDHDRSGWWLLLVAGVLTGLLPLFHTHTYLGIGLISVFLFLLRPRRQWLVFWVLAVILALPHLAAVIGHVSENSFMRFQPGWRGHNERFWLWFWLRNLGLPALLIIPAWLAAPAVWRKFYLAFVCLLVFSLFIVVTPNDYDNIKLIYLWYAPTSVLVAAWLVRLAVVHRQRFLVPVLALLCIASGALAVQYEIVSQMLLYTHEEMAAATFAREQTARRALFLTAPTVHQPILSLAGRPVLRGDTAWLWSHGYEFAQREADVKSIYAGSDEARALIDYYGVDYVYLGPRERQAGANQVFFESNLPAVYRSPNISIYDARPNRAGDPDSRVPASVSPREFASRLDKDPYQVLVEFRRVGYPVYRFYSVALARRPRYQEFMDDLKIAGRGLYVGASDWQQVLESNRRKLVEKWLDRADFEALYERKSNEQYIDALFRNAGISPRGDERQLLVTSVDNKAESRGEILRRVVESPAFNRSEFNDAYILIHYFGYLRRNPDDPPDNSLAGFNFWLENLNRTGDYRGVSRVFIESGEYKDRRP